MSLDLRTLLVMTLLNLLLASVASFVVWRANRSIAGLGSFAAGLSFICFGFVCNSFLVVPLGPAAAFFGGCSLVGGLVVILQGALQFRGFRPLPRWVVPCLFALLIPVQFEAVFLHQDKVLRSSSIALCLGLLSLASAAVLARRLRSANGYLFGTVALSLGFYGSVQLLKFVYLAVPVLRKDSTAVPSLNTLVLLSLNICIEICLISLVNAVNVRLREQIEKLAFHDPLTGLLNRRGFEDYLEQALLQVERSASTAALIYIDLNRFKWINDRFGHHGGDIALQYAARQLATAAGEGDCLARIGGDEFVVLTERFGDRRAAMSLVLSLQRSLEEPLVIDGCFVRLSISCGLAFYPGDVESSSDLIRGADAEMYRHKREAASASR